MKNLKIKKTISILLALTFTTNLLPAFSQVQVEEQIGEQPQGEVAKPVNEAVVPEVVVPSVNEVSVESVNKIEDQSLLKEESVQEKKEDLKVKELEEKIVNDSSDLESSTAVDPNSDEQVLLTELYKQRVEQNVYQGKPDPISGLTFSDLVKLTNQAKPEPALNKKLQSYLTMVYITNRTKNIPFNMSYIRVAQWNINRGFNVQQILEGLQNPEEFKKKYVSRIRARNRKNFDLELNSFATSDILCFCEADIGMPRTNYKNIPAQIADELGWHYVYAPEFVELGPIFQKQKLDTNKYRGLHGNVIISKFPIVSAEVIRIPNYYDWYGEEVEKHKSPLEYVRAGGAKAIFSQGIEYREVRHGSRSALLADLKLPNNQIITVVSTHLEDRAYPDERLKQFNFLLEKIKNKKTPVILTGDFNTSTTDTKPTSLKKEWVKRVRDPHWVLRTTGSFFVPGLPILSGLAAVAFSKLLQYKDPFYPSIPVIFPNHERKFYAALRKFRFSDGNKFDLRGEKSKSSNGRRGLLANSNQRHWKGFKSTFRLVEPRIIAYFKTDWFFVKPLGEKYIPFNGRTLKTFNGAIKKGISDHNPITVDIKL